MTAERVREVSVSGEPIIITIRGEPVARIVPERAVTGVGLLLDRVAHREPLDTGALAELIASRDASVEPVDADWHGA